jgi:hypothetical protein
MSEFDVLLTFMNLAVAFAGFTGVVTMIDRGAARVSRDVVSFRVRYLVFGAIVVLGLCTLPPILTAYNVSPEAVWRIACAVAAVIMGLFLAGLVRARVRLANQEGLSRVQFNTTLPAGILAVLALAAAAAGLIPAVGTYLVGVFYMIAAIALLFMRLVLMLDESIRNRGQ